MEAVLEADEKLPVSTVYSLGHRFLGATLTVLAREELRRKREMKTDSNSGGDMVEEDGATPEQVHVAVSIDFFDLRCQAACRWPTGQKTILVHKGYWSVPCSLDYGFICCICWIVG
jgi:hypothetical protein